jgi:hypothetical protein
MGEGAMGERVIGKNIYVESEIGLKKSNPGM